MTHTIDETHPWWQMDLQGTRRIRQIRLWNRTDCCQTRLSNFCVLISATPFGSNSLDTELARSDVISHFYEGQVYDVAALIPELDLIGRYLRIWLSGQGELSLAEVEVLE